MSLQIGKEHSVQACSKGTGPLWTPPVLMHPLQSETKCGLWCIIKWSLCPGPTRSWCVPTINYNGHISMDTIRKGEKAPQTRVVFLCSASTVWPASPDGRSSTARSSRLWMVTYQDHGFVHFFKGPSDSSLGQRLSHH